MDINTTQIELLSSHRDINGKLIYGQPVVQERELQRATAIIRKSAKYRGVSGNGFSKLANEREVLQALIEAGWLPPSAYTAPVLDSGFEEGPSFPEGYSMPSAD